MSASQFAMEDMAESIAALKAENARLRREVLDLIAMITRALETARNSQHQQDDEQKPEHA